MIGFHSFFHFFFNFVLTAFCFSEKIFSTHNYFLLAEENLIRTQSSVSFLGCPSQEGACTSDPQPGTCPPSNLATLPPARFSTNHACTTPYTCPPKPYFLGLQPTLLKVKPLISFGRCSAQVAWDARGSSTFELAVYPVGISHPHLSCFLPSSRQPFSYLKRP